MQTGHFERKKKQRKKDRKRKSRLIIFLILILIILIIKKVNNIHACTVDNYFAIYEKTNEIQLDDYVIFRKDKNKNKIAKVVRKTNNGYILQINGSRFYEEGITPRENIYGKKVLEIYNIFSNFKYKPIKIITIIVLILILIMHQKESNKKEKRNEKRDSIID